MRALPIPPKRVTLSTKSPEGRTRPLQFTQYYFGHAYGSTMTSSRVVSPHIEVSAKSAIGALNR